MTATILKEGEKEMVEIVEAAPVEQKLTESELIDSGFEKEEIETAKKEGLIQVEEVKKEEAPAPKEQVPLTEVKRPSIEEVEADPEKENELLKDFNKNEKGLYWRAKKDKLKRQQVEAERDQMKLRYSLLEKKISDLETRITAKPEVKKSDETSFADLLVDENGEPAEKQKAEEVEKPLTRKDLELIEKEKSDNAEKEKALQVERLNKVRTNLTILENDAKSRYEDFESAMTLTNELVERTVSGKLSDWYTDPKEVRKIESKVREFLTMIGNADKYSEEDYNPADLGFELSNFHPKHGKANAEAEQTGNKTSKEELERIERNANKRSSSASISGGTRRLVSMEDITPEEAINLPPNQWLKLPEKVRERLLREV